MKRLYIGGLSHTISEKDIRDRFGKFGEVCDVEIKTRKDEDGSPFKTFCYVNINISDSDYKRCVTVLNKSKWKGGTLQIEPAKESFLHRLADERQQAVEKIQVPRIDPQEKIMESFKVAGVENFHMKSAVPGTEIPGHKDWVVSKFGRVLPVLHLKARGKNKVMKYDPSKHCHNIRKLDPEESFTPVSGLTWRIDGGNDEISKKRRGEFPPQKRRPSNNAPFDLSGYLSSKRDGDQRTSGFNREQMKPPRDRRVCVFNDDSDSEDEIRELIARERLRAGEPAEDDGNLEVVDHEFAVKSGTFWGGDLGSSRDDEEYDSADTDEILSLRKNPRAAEGPNNDGGEDPGSKDELTVTSSAASSRPESEPGAAPGAKLKRGATRIDREEKSKRFKPDVETLGNGLEESSTSGGLQRSLRNAGILGNSSCHGSTVSQQSSKKEIDRSPEGQPTSSVDSGPDSDSDSSEDSEYEGMMGNCQMLTLSLADLQDLVENMDGGSSHDEGEPSDPKRVPDAQEKPAVDPEDILASLLESDDEQEESGREDAGTSTLPPFVGTEDLFGSDLRRGAQRIHSDLKGDSKRFKPHLEISGSAPGKTSASGGSQTSSTKPNEETGGPPERQPTSSHEGSKGPGSVSSPAQEVAPDRPETSEDASEDVKENPDGKPVRCPPDPRRQQQDNRRRLAALEQRQKEAEQQKKLIQGALSLVDVPSANRGRHIVFESDDEAPADQGRSLLAGRGEEDDGVEDRRLNEEVVHQAAASKLFDSGDEDDEGAEEDRFRIKPQFEGVAGRKLMELQSRFGTDPRFQMDAKFLDDDDDGGGGGRDEDGGWGQAAGEQELVEEKKKNLAILQSLLNVQPGDPTKASVKAKTFRDVSALHYDPTSEAHAAFETRPEEAKKESKAARRKKREEARKLPEVSKEIFYDVTADLKDVFGAARETQPEKENPEASWDQRDEDASGVSSSVDVEPEDATGGFKFSFFAEESGAETLKTDEYKAEVLKGAKVPWQVDPRLQDSSSDEEEEEEMDQSDVTAAPEAPTQTRTFFFFFFDGDVRLKEGPGMFCRSEKLEDQRKAWEERRAGLREDCRKKHKDAKRRHKMTMKT